jgi:uncharacterized membrane protein
MMNGSSHPRKRSCSGSIAWWMISTPSPGLWLRAKGVPLGEDERRRMRVLLDRASRDVDELFDLATAAAHVQAKIEKGTN